MTVADFLRAGAALALAVITIAVVAAALGRAVAVLPVHAGRRAVARRWLPVLRLGIAALVLVATALFIVGPSLAGAVAAVIAVVMLGSSWFAIRDVAAGAVLRAEHDFEAGQNVSWKDGAGTIRTVGARSLQLEGADGQRLYVPYSRLQHSEITVARARGGAEPVRFSLTLPAAESVADDAAAIRAAALHAVHVSATREPKLRVAREDAGSRTWEVTVYTIDPAFLPDIEAAVTAETAGRAAR